MNNRADNYSTHTTTTTTTERLFIQRKPTSHDRLESSLAEAKITYITNNILQTSITRIAPTGSTKLAHQFTMISSTKLSRNKFDISALQVNTKISHVSVHRTLTTRDRRPLDLSR